MDKLQNNFKKLRELAKTSFISGDLAAAEKQFEILEPYETNEVQSTIFLARIYNQQSRYLDAIEKWKLACSKKPQLKEPYIQLARLYRKIHNNVTAIDYYRQYLQHETEHEESITAIKKIEQELLHAHAPTPTHPLKHIAIAGVSYSGSTILSWVLGSLHAVENIGESHWLTHKRKIPSSAKTVNELSSCSSEIAIPCYTCGNDCEQLDSRFRESLNNNPSNWYYKIAEKLQCNTLVSADKNWAKYTQLDPLLRMNIIVLFKSPEQAWFSNYRKLNLQLGEMMPVKDVQKYKNAWINAYTHFINDFENKGDKIFLSFEHFCQKPQSHLERLCDIFSLDYDKNALASPVLGQHCFGGNPIAIQNHKDHDITIAIKPLAEAEIPVEHFRYIENCEDLQSLYQDLLSRYHQDFTHGLN